MKAETSGNAKSYKILSGDGSDSATENTCKSNSLNTSTNKISDDINDTDAACSFNDPFIDELIEESIPKLRKLYRLCKGRTDVLGMALYRELARCDDEFYEKVKRLDEIEEQAQSRISLAEVQTKEAILKTEAVLTKLKSKEQEILQTHQQIAALKQQLRKLRQEHEDNLTLCHQKLEVLK